LRQAPLERAVSRDVPAAMPGPRRRREQAERQECEGARLEPSAQRSSRRSVRHHPVRVGRRLKKGALVRNNITRVGRIARRPAFSRHESIRPLAASHDC
jgi:hypothetical protein